jgi:glycosyltransferase involved in cell wall biosynthesis
MHVSIMDPGLANRIGHHFDQDVRIARALTAQGHAVEVHATASVSPELVAAFAALGVPVHGTFRAGSYHRPIEGEDSWDHWQQRAAVTGDDLARLAPTDVAFWPSLTPSHFLAMVRAAYGAHIVGGLDGQINFVSPLGAELLASGRETAHGLAGRLELGTYDRFIADAYRPILAGLPIRRLPVPHDGQHTPPAEIFRRVGFFGHQRGERGADLLPEIAAALVQRGLKITIQDSTERIALRRAHPDISILGFVDDLPVELAACDLIVWPSNPQYYAARTSGIVWEAIASGRPVVVPSLCLPAQIAFHDGAATFFHQPTAKSVLRAIDEAIANYPVLARRADRQARRWRATEGTARLAAALTAGKLPRWETA